jgi:hypothetical protein
VWVGSIGARALLRGHRFAANAPVGRWLIGGVIAHDAVIAPAVFLLSAAAVRLFGVRVRRALAAVLLIGGSVLIVGLPDVLRKGHNPNPTVTPLDYTRNLIIVLLAVAGGVVLTAAAGAVRTRTRTRGHGHGHGQHGPSVLRRRPEAQPDEPEAAAELAQTRVGSEAQTQTQTQRGSAADSAAETERSEVPAPPGSATHDSGGAAPSTTG